MGLFSGRTFTSPARTNKVVSPTQPASVQPQVQPGFAPKRPQMFEPAMPQEPRGMPPGLEARFGRPDMPMQPFNPQAMWGQLQQRMPMQFQQFNPWAMWRR